MVLIILTSRESLLTVAPVVNEPNLLNPVTSNVKHIEKYGIYKKRSIFGINSYLYQYIAQTLVIVDKIIDIRIGSTSNRIDA